MVVDRAGVGVFVKVSLSTAAVPFVVIAPMVLSTQQEEIVYAGQPALEVGDEVVMVCNKSGSSYTAVDAIEY